jgi:saccharopine dehydrogenase-like NADP-dependent oxidoreductase
VRVNVVGAGAVGARVIRQLVEHDAPDAIHVIDRRVDHARRVATAMGPGVQVHEEPDARLPAADVTVVATAGGTHRVIAERALDAGQHVVSVGDGLGDVRALIDLGNEAAVRDRVVVVGAGFSPGLACLLARHAASMLDQVDEIHIAHHGTGGPDCARAHHLALSGDALDWRDGAWRSRRGRTGRELVWFPDPIGGLDCYRGALPGALLVAPHFRGVVRVTARVSATRRDRLTALLPMMRPPHDDGGPGAVRVEVRGWRGAETVTAVLGAVDRPSLAAATVAAMAVRLAMTGDLAPGATGLAAVEDAAPVLAELARRGVKAAVFEGSMQL